MKALLSARRVKKGQEEEFRRRWRDGGSPDGMLDALLLEDEEDPRETLSISLWDTAEKLLKYRTSDEARKRQEDMDDVVEKDRWNRAFVAFSAWEIPKAAGGKKWLLLPLLLAGAGAGAYFFLKRRGANTEDEWDTWEPEPATTFQPPEVIAGTMPPERPLAAEVRNGGRESRGTPDVVRQRGEPAGPVLGTVPGGTATGTAGYGTGAGTSSAARSATATHAAGATGGRTVRDFMTRDPETVAPGTDAATAARMMRDLNVGVLPVLADGNLAGIVTDRDLALGVSRQDAEPARVRVQAVMTEAPSTVRPEDSIEHAARVMAEHQIRRLPVVEGTRLVGILSLGDLAADGAERPAGAALHDISEPASPDR